MASYSVELTRTAEKQIRRVPKRDRGRIIEALESLGEKPRPREARKLQGYDEVYRIHIGQYGIVYEVYDDRVVIIVLKIGRLRCPQSRLEPRVGQHEPSRTCRCGTD